MIGEAALNGLFQWLPQGLFDIGKWGLGRRWNGNSKCPGKRKKGHEEEEGEGIKKRSKHCPSFLLKHKLVFEQSGSSPLPRVEAPENSTLESCPVISFSIGVPLPLGKRTCSYASVKDPASPVPHQAAPLAALKSGAMGVSAVCSGAQAPQLPAATTTTDFFDPHCSLFDDSDDDEAASAAVTTANSVDHPPLEALKGQLKLVLLDKGPKMITAQDQSTMAQLCEAIERHPAYSTADHGPMWTLRHLAKSFADILELSSSCQGLAEASAKYAQAKAELRAKKARARESHAEIEQRQRVAEKLNSEASRLRVQLAATEVKLTELENEVKMEKERDAALLRSIQAASNSCTKARTERGRLQREDYDLNKKMAEVNAAVAFLHPWLSL